MLFTDFHKLQKTSLGLQYTRGGVISITPLLDFIAYAGLVLVARTVNCRQRFLDSVCLAQTGGQSVSVNCTILVRAGPALEARNPD